MGWKRIPSREVAGLVHHAHVPWQAAALHWRLLLLLRLLAYLHLHRLCHPCTHPVHPSTYPHHLGRTIQHHAVAHHTRLHPLHVSATLIKRLRLDASETRLLHHGPAWKSGHIRHLIGECTHMRGTCARTIGVSAHERWATLSGSLHVEGVVGVGGAGLIRHESEAAVRALGVLKHGQIVLGLVLGLLGLWLDKWLACHQALVHIGAEHVVGDVHGEIRGVCGAAKTGRGIQRGGAWSAAAEGREEEGAAGERVEDVRLDVEDDERKGKLSRVAEACECVCHSGTASTPRAPFRFAPNSLFSPPSPPPSPSALPPARPPSRPPCPLPPSPSSAPCAQPPRLRRRPGRSRQIRAPSGCNPWATGAEPRSVRHMSSTFLVVSLHPFRSLGQFQHFAGEIQFLRTHQALTTIEAPPG